MVEIFGILIGAVAFFVLSWRNSKDNRKIGKIVSNLLSSILGGQLGLLLTVLICLGCGVSKTEFVSNETLSSSEEIIALADSSEVSGRHFLGSGSIGQDEYYVYYTDTELGFKREKIRADSVYIKYISDNEIPHIEHFSKTNQEILTKKPENAWFSFTFFLAYKDVAVGDVVSEGITKYSHTIIYIPEGSIQENYEIDLE